MKRNMQQGFTLIELMIVIAIVAILVALAVPAYQDYTIRAKIGECVNAAAVPKLQISEYFETVGFFPPDTNQAGMTANSGISQYCAGYTAYSNPGNTTTNASFQINVASGNVVPSGGLGAILPQMTGFNNVSGGVDWVCTLGGTDAADAKYLPSTCRSTTPAAP